MICLHVLWLCSDTNLHALSVRTSCVTIAIMRLAHMSNFLDWTLLSPRGEETFELLQDFKARFKFGSDVSPLASS